MIHINKVLCPEPGVEQLLSKYLIVEFGFWSSLPHTKRRDGTSLVCFRSFSVLRMAQQSLRTLEDEAKYSTNYFVVVSA